MSDNEDSDENI